MDKICRHNYSCQEDLPGYILLEQTNGTPDGPKYPSLQCPKVRNDLKAYSPKKPKPDESWRL